MTEKNHEHIVIATPDPMLAFTTAVERLKSTMKSNFEELRYELIHKLKTAVHNACDEIIQKIHENKDVPIAEVLVPQSTIPIETTRCILAPVETDCGKDILLSPISSAPGKSAIIHDRQYNSVGSVTGGKLSNSLPQANRVWKPKGFLRRETEHNWSRILSLPFKEQIGMIVVHCFEERELYDGCVDVLTYRIFGIYACDLDVFDPGGTYCVRHCVKRVPSVGNRLKGSRQGPRMGLQQLSAKLGVWADYIVRMNAGVLWTKLTWIIGSGDNKTVEATELTDNVDGKTFMFLVKYNPSTKPVSVLMEGVGGAIGYAVTSDGSWVLGRKFIKGNIKRHWIMLGDMFVEKTRIKVPCREGVELRSDFGNCLMLNFISNTIGE